MRMRLKIKVVTMVDKMIDLVVQIQVIILMKMKVIHLVMNQLAVMGRVILRVMVEVEMEKGDCSMRLIKHLHR